MPRRDPQPPAIRQARSAGLVALCTALAALAGCGGGSAASSSSVAVPEDCLRSWNSEVTSQNFGRHVYNSHQAKQAQVALLKPTGTSFNIRGKTTCAVVFSVPESDFEYGDVGLVVTRFGWASMQELARGDQVRLEQIQRDANSAPNVNLFPDGTLDPI